MRQNRENRRERIRKVRVLRLLILIQLHLHAQLPPYLTQRETVVGLQEAVETDDVEVGGVGGGELRECCVNEEGFA